jgi:hypothetical protein
VVVVVPVGGGVVAVVVAVLLVDGVVEVVVDVVVVVLVVGVLVVVDVVVDVEPCWHCLSASCETVDAAWFRLAWTVRLTVEGRLRISVWSLPLSVFTAPQSRAETAVDTALRLFDSLVAWSLESRPAPPPQAARHDTARPNPPTRSARGR